MAERQLPKLDTRVRFPSPAPAKRECNHLDCTFFVERFRNHSVWSEYCIFMGIGLYAEVVVIAISEILYMIAMGLAGFILAHSFRVPSPALLGPLLVVGMFRIFGFPVYSFPGSWLLVFQSVLGVYIGLKTNRDLFNRLRKLMEPTIAIIIWTLGINLGLGMILMWSMKMDPMTSFLATAPSGVSEMSMIALTTGADVGVVSVFHLFRLLLTIIFFPLMAQQLKNNKPSQEQTGTYWHRILLRFTAMCRVIFVSPFQKRIWHGSFRWLFTIGIGLVGSFIGVYLSIPAGALMGSFLLIAGFSIGGAQLQSPPVQLRTVLQVGIGLIIGGIVTDIEVDVLLALLPPILTLTIVMVASSIGMAVLLHKLTGWDRLSCLLATAPAGVTPMTLLADSLGARTLDVSLLHVVRLLVVKAIILPLLFYIWI